MDRYSLDNQANVTITGNTTLNNLSDGFHNIVIYANDTYGFMGESSRIFFTVVSSTNATVDNVPNTLNLRAKSKCVTAFIELPEGYNVSDIDTSAILMNDTIPVDPNAPPAIGDYDNDTIPDLMVKFNGTEVIEYILNNINMTQMYEERFMTVILTITGKLYDGTPFAGSDVIRVMMPGRRGLGKRAFPI